MWEHFHADLYNASRKTTMRQSVKREAGSSHNYTGAQHRHYACTCVSIRCCKVKIITHCLWYINELERIYKENGRWERAVCCFKCTVYFSTERNLHCKLVLFHQKVSLDLRFHAWLRLIAIWTPKSIKKEDKNGWYYEIHHPIYY
jgi:hypothetical protein